MDGDGERRVPPGEVLVIAGELDRRRAEALCLEIRALARQCGVEIARLNVVSGTPPSPADGEETAGA